MTDSSTQKRSPPWMLGVDTGGTFTDFVLLGESGLRVHKVLSTPVAPERAILQGIKEMGLRASDLQIIHGSTVATNAVLEGKGVRTVYIGNRGLGDLLTIGRQARRELYNLQPAPIDPPVPGELCLETGGRLGADGSTVDDLTSEDLKNLGEQLRRLGPRAVAINLLFSYLDDRFERAIEAAVPDNVFVSRSSGVIPEFREYERGITTWLNAYVGPLVAGYLDRLQQGIDPAPLAVMQSTGLTTNARHAGLRAVELLLSGPAGGLMGARFMGAASSRERLLSFDMGGTSTDVALIDGQIELTSEGSIGDYPVAVPMVDMHTIGAGGGSIASLDSGGMLQVGPESAGADPGPACYGQNGTVPTVTDANLVLGRLRSDAFLGGAMTLDISAAEAVVGRLAESLGSTLQDTALGIVRVANEHMVRALRVISVERGIDPRDFTLTSFGGAGGLHVCALAESMGMNKALVPANAGVLSALGMLVAPRGRCLSRTFAGLFEEMSISGLERQFVSLAKRGLGELQEEGIDGSEIKQERQLDLRYRGQSYTLTVPWIGKNQTLEEFHRLHELRYGHSLDMPVEVVNVRLALSGPLPEIELCSPQSNTGDSCERASLGGAENPVPVYRRSGLGQGVSITGPAIIVEQISTTFLESGWRCTVGAAGNLELKK